MVGHEKSDGRHRSRILVGMEPGRRGEPGPKAPIGQHAGVARRGHHQLKKGPIAVGQAGQPGPARRAHSLSGLAGGDGMPAGTGRRTGEV